MGAVRAQGNEIDIPTIEDAKKHFDDWLMSDHITELDSDDIVIRRALGLSER
jgi:hypothetical protein